MISCCPHDSIPSPTMQLSTCLCVAVIKIPCSPETHGKAHAFHSPVHMCMTTHTHAHIHQKPTRERGSQATVNTVREEIVVKTVFLFVGYFGVQLFASQTHFYITSTHSINVNQNDSKNRKARVVTCRKNLLNKPILSQTLQN